MNVNAARAIASASRCCRPRHVGSQPCSASRTRSRGRASSSSRGPPSAGATGPTRPGACSSAAPTPARTPPTALNVDRQRFDAILLDNAAARGVAVHRGQAVLSVGGGRFGPWARGRDRCSRQRRPPSRTGTVRCQRERTDAPEPARAPGADLVALLPQGGGVGVLGRCRAAGAPARGQRALRDARDRAWPCLGLVHPALRHPHQRRRGCPARLRGHAAQGPARRPERLAGAVRAHDRAARRGAAGHRPAVSRGAPVRGLLLRQRRVPGARAGAGGRCGLLRRRAAVLGGPSGHLRCVAGRPLDRSGAARPPARAACDGRVREPYQAGVRHLLRGADRAVRHDPPARALHRAVAQASSQQQRGVRRMGPARRCAGAG